MHTTTMFAFCAVLSKRNDSLLQQKTILINELKKLVTDIKKSGSPYISTLRRTCFLLGILFMRYE